MKKFILASAMLLTAGMTFAQKGVEDGSKWGHGADSVRCIMNYTQYGDAVKQKDYKGAYEPWLVCFNECPLCKKTTLYIDGVKIAKALYQSTKDEQYYDLLLKVYDQRMKYYGTDKNYPTSYLKGMKALDILSYKEGEAADKEAIALFDEAFKGDAKTIDPAFVQKYILSTVNLFKSGAYTAENVVNNYINAGNIISSIQNSGKTFSGKTEQEKADKKEKFDASVLAAKDQVDQIFAQSGAADVETLNNVFGPQLEANKDNVDWLKKVNKFLSKSKGGDESELFFATSEYLHKIEPAASSARGLARMNLKKGETNAAIDYYKQAIELEEENAEKAKYYYELSMAHFSLHAFAAAKSAAYNAANLREGWGDPYILLGKIYAAGASSVGNEDWEKKAGYWAAVDKFAKAKAIDENCTSEANQLIGQYSQYFPGKEDLFMHGQKVGDSYTVGGFIGETTKIRAK